MSSLTKRWFFLALHTSLDTACWLIRNSLATSCWFSRPTITLWMIKILSLTGILVIRCFRFRLPGVVSSLKSGWLMALASVSAADLSLRFVGPLQLTLSRAALNSSSSLDYTTSGGATYSACCLNRALRLVTWTPICLIRSWLSL